MNCRDSALKQPWPSALEDDMQKNSGKKKEKCKNCEGKGLIKNGLKKMKCQRCGGSGFKS